MFFFELIYFTSFHIFRKIAFLFFGVQVTTRHSFLSPEFIPLKSDIDFSFYCKSISSVRKLKHLYSLFKLIFPFFGEFYVYTDKNLNFINTNNFNLFEENRDPLLKNKNLVKKKYSKPAAQAFLLNAVINDFKNLSQNKSHRLIKWNKHFSDINSALNLNLNLNPKNLLNSILTNIVNLDNNTSKQNAEIKVSKLYLYLAYLNSPFNLFEIKSALEQDVFFRTHFASFCTPMSLSKVVLTLEDVFRFEASIHLRMLFLIRQIPNTDVFTEFDLLNELINTIVCQDEGGTLILQKLQINLNHAREVLM